MRTVFADTLYWVAVLNRRDQWHDRARQLTRSLVQVVLVTTEEVLIETLTSLSGGGSTIRNAAVETVRDMRTSDHIQVLPQTAQSFEDGLELYARRPDKTYSMTDCISMAAMRRLGLTEVLTHDRHFAQEGFVVLL